MKYIEFRAESLRKKVSSEFEIELGEELKMRLIKRINVSSYKNMRDINKQIKKEFLEYFESQQNPSIMIGNKESLEKVSFKNKLLGIFTN